MRRIGKEITAAVLSVCILVVADPFLESGLVKAETTTKSTHMTQIETISPESIADLLARLQGSNTEVFDSASEEETEVTEAEPSAAPAQEDETMESEDAEVDTEDAETDEETEAVSDDEPTLDEVKAEILTELTENGSYTFDWYGTAITLSYKDYVYFCKLVQRETVGEDVQGRIMVANVVLNRVINEYYPGTVVKVINEYGQFAPVTEGIVESAVPDDTTIDAVLSAMAGVDYSQGALFFKMSDGSDTWSSGSDIRAIFTHGCHTFYR